MPLNTRFLRRGDFADVGADGVVGMEDLGMR
jgi:hypothetical protein